MGEVALKIYCSVCGGVLGPCRHEESRGPRGGIGKQESCDETDDAGFIFNTDYQYCKVYGGPLRNSKIACVFCGTDKHLNLSFISKLNYKW